METRIRRSKIPCHADTGIVSRSITRWCLIVVTSVILGLLLAGNHDDDQGFVTVFLIGSLVVVVPVHFAIEANRRDALNAGHHQAGDPDQEGSPGPV